MVGKRGSLVERFWAKVSTGGDDECWLWKATKNNKGYGLIHELGRPHKVLAHRVSWRLHYGGLTDSDCVLHRCDTPACVNPRHLFLGSKQDNVDDMIAKGRANRRGLKGEESPHAKLTETDVDIIRRRLLRGERVRPLARELNMEASAIRNIRDGKSWAHSSPGPIKQTLAPYRGSTHANSKLTEDQVRSIKAGLAAGRRGKDLAAEFGVTPSTICDINRGRGWAWI